jgi:hypothetical protein
MRRAMRRDRATSGTTCTGRWTRGRRPDALHACPAQGQRSRRWWHAMMFRAPVPPCGSPVEQRCAPRRRATGGLRVAHESEVRRGDDAVARSQPPSACRPLVAHGCAQYARPSPTKVASARAVTTDATKPGGHETAVHAHSEGHRGLVASDVSPRGRRPHADCDGASPLTWPQKPRPAQLASRDRAR